MKIFKLMAILMLLSNQFAVFCDTATVSQFNGIDDIADVTSFVQANAGKKIWVDNCAFNGNCPDKYTYNSTIVPMSSPILITVKQEANPAVASALHVFDKSGNDILSSHMWYDVTLPANAALALYGNDDALGLLYGSDAKTSVMKIIAKQAESVTPAPATPAPIKPAPTPETPAPVMAAPESTTPTPASARSKMCYLGTQNVSGLTGSLCSGSNVSKVRWTGKKGKKGTCTVSIKNPKVNQAVSSTQAQCTVNKIFTYK